MALRGGTDQLRRSNNEAHWSWCSANWDTKLEREMSIGIVQGKFLGPKEQFFWWRNVCEKLARL